MISESTKYRIKNWDKIRERERTWNKTYYYRNRDKVYALLGNVCVKCGNTDKRVFQVDHVGGGGNSRKLVNRGGQGRLKRTLNEIESGSRAFQLLCANCNIIKKFENNEIRDHVRADFYGQNLVEKAIKKRKTIRD